MGLRKGATMKLKARELGELAREIARLRAHIRELRKEVSLYKDDYRNARQEAAVEREARLVAEQDRRSLERRLALLRESLQEATATLQQLIDNHRAYRDISNNDDWSQAHIRNMDLLDQLLKDADEKHAGV